MLDESLASQGRGAKTGTLEQKLAHRRQLKRDGHSAGIDYSIPHKYVVDGKAGRGTYGEGVARLRANCADSVLQPFYKGVTRPFTLAENMRARLESDDPNLWNVPLKSCTGVLYKKVRRSPVQFKIIEISEHLLALPEGFSDKYLPLAFDAVQTKEVLRETQWERGQIPTPASVRKSRAWLAAAGYDQRLLNDYVACAEAKAREFGDMELFFMDFLHVTRSSEDQLRTLTLCEKEDSYACVYFHLGNGGGFARVVPR